jgi:hypothetical protein
MQAGNYIHQLQMAVRYEHDIIREAHETYVELATYLSSSKFHEDPTVQVADVLRRLDPLVARLRDAFTDKEINRLTKSVIATGEITSL